MRDDSRTAMSKPLPIIRLDRRTDYERLFVALYDMGYLWANKKTCSDAWETAIEFVSDDQKRPGYITVKYLWIEKPNPLDHDWKIATSSGRWMGDGLTSANSVPHFLSYLKTVHPDGPPPHAIGHAD